MTNQDKNIALTYKYALQVGYSFGIWDLISDQDMILLNIFMRFIGDPDNTQQEEMKLSNATTRLFNKYNIQ